jgi:hypothetical protein
MAHEFYIGTKHILGVPMTRLAYNQYRGWKLPEDENGDDEGYLVEYSNGGEKNHPAHEGYISWSPKAVFEAAYQPVTEMNFGHALEMLHHGHSVCRAGWNGKGMFIYLVPAAAAYPAQTLVAKAVFGEMVPYNAYLALKGVDGTVSTWVPSISDVLANDWSIV